MSNRAVGRPKKRISLGRKIALHILLAPVFAFMAPITITRLIVKGGLKLRDTIMATKSKTSDTRRVTLSNAAEEAQIEDAVEATADGAETADQALLEAAGSDTLPKIENERQFRAEMIVKEHMIASLGLGLIPIPFVDLATGLASNVVLVSRLCTLYEQPFKASIARTAVLSIMGIIGSVGVAVTVGFSLAKLIPGIGTVAGSVALPIANAATAYVIGKMFIGHFEMGGTLFDFDPRSNVPQARRAYANGRELAGELLASRKKASDDTAAASADAAAATT